MIDPKEEVLHLMGLDLKYGDKLNHVSTSVRGLKMLETCFVLGYVDGGVALEIMVVASNDVQTTFCISPSEIGGEYLRV